MSHPSGPQLARVIGRWSLLGLAVNGIIGSGIFGLPTTLAGILGAASPYAVVLGGAAMALIVACYAEVASQFDASGGTYLYVSCALGRLAGIQVGWMMLLVRLTACAASANLFVSYLGEFWPGATQATPRFIMITLLFGTLATANYRGASAGTSISSVSVAAKLLALGALCAAGTLYMATHAGTHEVAARVPLDSWLNAVLLLFFAYGGYEIVLNAGGETRNPRRDAPFALFVGLLVVTLLYTTLQIIVLRLVPNLANSTRPLADAARILAGPAGSALVSAAALLSVYGFLSASMLGMPRGIFALAESGDFPIRLAAVHPKFRTPYVSILAFALPAWLAAELGSFSWNVTLSSVARLFYFGAVCAAVPALRRKQPSAAAFRIPAGPLLPFAGIAICVLLLTRIDLGGSLILAATIAVALLNWVLVKGR